MEDLLKKHRLEQRDLQNRITQKKKSASKKTRKGVNDECVELEHQLKERQLIEVGTLGSGNKIGETATADEFEDTTDHAGTEQPALFEEEILEKSGASLTTDGAEDTQPRQKKPNRQKVRLARRTAGQEAVSAKAAEEALSVPDLRAKEQEVMASALSSHGLVELAVRSDGNCLYAAMADQLKLHNLLLQAKDKSRVSDYKLVRQEAATYMLEHEDDFFPFLDEDESEKGMVEYARKVRDTAEWGGQLEIMACARRWALLVNVLQGDGRIEKIDGSGGSKNAKECWLAYYRHSFGLGEHYNSLRRRPEKSFQM